MAGRSCKYGMPVFLLMAYPLTHKGPGNVHALLAQWSLPFSHASGAKPSVPYDGYEGTGLAAHPGQLWNPRVRLWVLKPLPTANTSTVCPSSDFVTFPAKTPYCGNLAFPQSSRIWHHIWFHLRSRKETRLFHLLTGVNISLSCSTWNGNWPDTQGLTHGHCARGPCFKEAGTSRVPLPLHSSHRPLSSTCHESFTFPRSSLFTYL